MHFVIDKNIKYLFYYLRYMNVIFFKDFQSLSCNSLYHYPNHPTI